MRLHQDDSFGARYCRARVTHLEQNLVGSWFDADLHLGHHLGSGRPRQSDGSVAAVRHDDVAGPLSISEQVGL